MAMNQGPTAPPPGWTPTPTPPPFQQPPASPPSEFPPTPSPQQDSFAGSESRPLKPGLHPSLQHDRFLIRRKILTFIGRKMHTYDEMMNLLLFTHMKGFKLKEDITVYADIERQEPLLRIRARRIIDIAATYDIHDVSGGGEVHIGALKRKGLKSFVRDEWLIFDTQDREIGLIQEDSSDLALVRRFISAAALVLPQSYNFTLHGRPVGFMKQNFNPFVMKLTADFTEDIEQKFDRRLAAAAATLLCCIEGKQR